MPPATYLCTSEAGCKWTSHRPSDVDSPGVKPGQIRTRGGYWTTPCLLRVDITQSSRIGPHHWSQIEGRYGARFSASIGVYLYTMEREPQTVLLCPGVRKGRYGRIYQTAPLHTERASSRPGGAYCLHDNFRFADPTTASRFCPGPRPEGCCPQRRHPRDSHQALRCARWGGRIRARRPRRTGESRCWPR